MAISPWKLAVDAENRELVPHGTEAFPIGCYRDELHKLPVPWHWHDEWEAAVVARGSTVVATGLGEVRIGPGDGFFINAGVLHECADAVPGEECVYHSMCFRPALIGAPGSVFWEKYVEPIQRSGALRLLVLSRDVAWQREALSCIERAWQCVAGEPEDFELEVRGALGRLAALLARNLPPASAAAQSAAALRDEARIKAMLACVRARYADELTAADIARSAAVSESECLRCFKRVIGMTPMQYVKQYRLEQAEALLRTGRCRVGEAAERCGFREMSYFARAFRQRRGMTPSEYAAARGGSEA